jgi:signal transduction histidine kinase/FixJ family two-component response regulator
MRAPLRTLAMQLTLLLALAMGVLGMPTRAWAGDDALPLDEPIAMQQASVIPGPCQAQQEGRPVPLPDDWRKDGLPTPGVACYHVRLVMPRSPVVPWALRIDRLPGNHRITLNGIPLSTRHMDGDAITSVASLPYLIELPVNVLLAGDNDLDIEVRMNRFGIAGISPLLAGPVSDLRPDFDRWVLFTVNLPQTMNLTVTGMALFLLLAWRARPRDVVFRYFGTLMLVMCGRNALYYLETTALPPALLDWAFFAAQAVSTYYIVLFGLVYADKPVAPWLTHLRVVCGALPLVALGAIGSPLLDTLRVLAYPLFLLLGMTVLVPVLRHAWAQHWLEALAMTVGTVGTFVSVLHDYTLLLPHESVLTPYWTPYFSPIIFLGFALTLMRRFIEATTVAERMNITLEERVAERTRALEAANQSKTRFLAAASHDLRQPTAAIGLLVSLLRQRETSPQTREVVGMLDEAVASMENLLVGLLDISRLDAGAVKPEFQSVNLRDVFQAVRVHEQSNAEGKGLKLRFRLPREPGGRNSLQPMVLTDPMLLHSVLRNLVANAIRYTHTGGVLVAARRRGKHRLRIEVWDSGIGIAPEQQDRIFEEFYQVGNLARERNRGIGLGLAIVRRTATILGERITLKSRLGRGSVFALELPLNLVAAPSASASKEVTQPLLGRTIWLVEDDLILRRAMAEMLHAWGAATRSWPDAESLLEELPQLLAGNRQESLSPTALPDKLITDHRLPGMTGLQMVQTVSPHLHAQGQAHQCLIISGDTDPIEIARLSASGHAVLAKPFRSERLLEQLQRPRPLTPERTERAA